MNFGTTFVPALANMRVTQVMHGVLARVVTVVTNVATAFESLARVVSHRTARKGRALLRVAAISGNL